MRTIKIAHLPTICLDTGPYGVGIRTHRPRRFGQLFVLSRPSTPTYGNINCLEIEWWMRHFENRQVLISSCSRLQQPSFIHNHRLNLRHLSQLLNYTKLNVSLWVQIRSCTSGFFCLENVGLSNGEGQHLKETGMSQKLNKDCVKCKIRPFLRRLFIISLYRQFKITSE